MDPKNQKQPLKKMIPQLLISVSLFSFLISYSSLYNSSSSSSSPSSSLVYPAGSLKFHHYFSANSFQLNKNCLFLICNGLLVFLAKTSGLIQPPSANDVLVGDAFGASLDKYVLEEEEEETTGSDDPAGGGGGKIAAAADGIKEVSIFIAESEEEEGGNGGAAADDAGKDENEPDSRRSCWLFDEDGEQLYGPEANDDEHEHEHEHHEDDDDDEEMSTEELNRKFEDFIRKMKEDIIINEARQKSLMLN